MEFINLNEAVKTAVRIATAIAREYQNEQYAPPHLLKALLHKEIGLRSFIQNMNKDLKYIDEWAEMRVDSYPKVVITPDDKTPQVFEEADNVRLKLGLPEINPVCVLATLTKPNVGFTADQLKSFPLREKEILDLYISGKEVQSNVGFNNLFEDTQRGKEQPLANLHTYCIDKTALAADLKIHKIVSRDRETRMMLEILGRRSKPNVMVIGDPGVGKTALIDGLAYDIVNNNVPRYLKGSIIYELNTDALIAGATYKGEIEDRLKSIINEIRNIDKAILFIDEIHVLLDPKQGNSGAVTILKSELSKGDLIVIGATTVDEYRELIEPDQAFNKSFEVLQINEPDIDSAIRILQSVLPEYAEFHSLNVSTEAIEECVRLAKRYVNDRKLPDSAISLMDRTMSATKMVNETLDTVCEFTKEKVTTIGAYEIAAIISAKAGIPIEKVQAEEKEQLLNMEELLRQKVAGQDQAIKSLVDTILESRSGMNKAGQPIGSFFLLGPTGTGKTELAKSLAEVLFNDEKAMIRFNMSEFKEEHSAALLYGAPRGYAGYEEGGLLINKIRKQPYAVLVFDEIEKAHSSVYDIFLQIMNEGKLRDRLGKEGDFSNAVLIFTSTIENEWLTNQLDSGITPTTTQMMEVLNQYFRPEFLAGLSEIVPFSPINGTMLLKIFNIQLKNLVEVLNKQGIEVEIDEDTCKLLAMRGFTSKYGARQIAGTIRTYLRRPISRLIVGGELSRGHKLVIGNNENEELTWDITSISKIEPEVKTETAETIETEPVAAPEIEVEPEIEIKTETEVEVNSEDETKTDTEIKAEVDLQPEPETEVHAEIRFKPEVEVRPKTLFD